MKICDLPTNIFNPQKINLGEHMSRFIPAEFLYSTERELRINLHSSLDCINGLCYS